MRAFTILCLMLVATKFGMSLAHVLELPGKLRLDEATYKAVQAIYYPGFTIAGFIGEFGGMVALAVLLYRHPTGRAGFGGQSAPSPCWSQGTRPIGSLRIRSTISG